MNKVFVKRIKENLLTQKKELGMKNTTEQDIDTDGDETDEIQAHILIEISNQLNTRNNAKLLKIEDALQKIKNNTYGLCEDCEEPINEKRLLANPYFVTCISCAEDRETEENKRKKL